MIYIALSIVSSSLILVIFRLFKTWKVDLFPAIVANYLVAGSLGFVLDNGQVNQVVSGVQSWWFYALTIGILFITLFNLMGKSSQLAGLGVTSVAVKLSMVIPVFGAIWLYNEPFGLMKTLAMVCAVAALIFIRPASNTTTSTKALMYPTLLFFGSGLLDLLLNRVQVLHLEKGDFIVFTSIIFGVAGCIGLATLGLTFKSKSRTISIKEVIGGFALGLVNYGSIYFLLEALSESGIQASVVFPTNNLGIVLLSSFFGLTLFREKLSLRQGLGLGLAFVAIALLIGI